MQIPETPASLADLALMRRLAECRDGRATYLDEGTPLGQQARDTCGKLYEKLKELEATVAPLLNKVTAREMNTFTSHDATHAQKAAHLMWHIIAPARRQRLTPPEIGVLNGFYFCPPQSG